ncbi:LD-carboxypeptidase [Halorubellus sp. JP-L1]|uniref:LD-carboxypeptidase n=1 Tax=Halorubellus sp. JP-L1 TaxID=2715753 RepID=UPI00140E56C4|nr:LD-carboxypeptidase [Halorubellus sp. JP-L1]NHN41462.1 LD-carboxypeptidase [Halorubellus sp. JP-L1]
MPKPVQSPPVADDQSVLVLPTSSQVPGFVVDRAADRLRKRFDVAVERSPLLDADGPPAPDDVASALEAAFRDPDVGAVVAASGGDRQVRVLEHLDRDALAANPTRFFGISDNTNLHCALASADVVSYYGGQCLPGLALDNALADYTAEYLERALFDESLGVVEPADSYTDGHFDFETEEPREWRPAHGWTWNGFDGPVTGRVRGGCLEVLEWVAAADPAGDLVPASEPAHDDGRVLLVETSEELPSPAHVRRVLQNLGARGTLDDLDAVLVGRPKTRHEDSPPQSERDAYRRHQRTAIAETVRDYADAPILFDFDVGHTDPHVPVPLGARVTLDPREESVTFH